MTDEMGGADTVDTPERRNGHNGDLAELATNLRSSFDARLPAFVPSQTDKLHRRSGLQDQLSEALKKHHRYTLLLVLLVNSASLSCHKRSGMPFQIDCMRNARQGQS